MENKNFKFLSILTIFMATTMQLSLIVAYKPIQIGWFIVPGGIIVGFPIVFTLGDIITEVYGYQKIKRIVWECLLCTAIFATMTMLIIDLPSPKYWMLQTDYNIVLGKVWRVFFALFIGVVTSMFVNVYLMARWKVWLRGRYFVFRCFFSNSIGELIITAIADITGFWGTMDFQKFMHMVISVYLFKVIYALIASIPASYISTYLKKHEGVDVYDKATNFNPFSIKT